MCEEQPIEGIGEKSGPIGPWDGQGSPGWVARGKMQVAPSLVAIRWTALGRLA